MKFFRKIAPIITVFIFIVSWWALAEVKDYPLLYPKLSEIFTQFIEILGKRLFYLSVLGSLLRTIVSFLFAFIFAMVFAVISSRFEVVKRLFYPIALFVRATPTMCVIFLSILWFPSSYTPMIVASAVIFPTLYASALTAIESCDKDLIEMSKVYKVPNAVQIKKLYLPYVFERVYSDAISAISLNVKLVIAAEALSQTQNSLGLLMQISYGGFEIASLFAYTVFAVILSFLLEVLLKAIRLFLRRLRDAKTS